MSEGRKEVEIGQEWFLVSGGGYERVFIAGVWDRDNNKGKGIRARFADGGEHIVTEAFLQPDEQGARYQAVRQMEQAILRHSENRVEQLSYVERQLANLATRATVLEDLKRGLEATIAGAIRR